jgi:hypothetical protein
VRDWTFGIGYWVSGVACCVLGIGAGVGVERGGLMWERRVYGTNRTDGCGAWALRGSWAGGLGRGGGGLDFRGSDAWGVALVEIEEVGLLLPFDLLSKALDLPL